MNIYISTETGILHAQNHKQQIKCFTEYGLRYQKIDCQPLPKNLKVEMEIDKLLLIPMTHITNLWHFLHHIFITFKYLKKNNITSDYVYFLFFPNFYERQGDIINARYNELLFAGLNLNFDNFKKIHNVFTNNSIVRAKKILLVNDIVTFHQPEPLFQEFRDYLLDNLKIVRKEESKTKTVTFVLRRGTRMIKNSDFLQENMKMVNFIYLEDYSLTKQLEIISNTDIFIGVHGAGITWATFMKKGSLLIEIYPGRSNTDNYIRWCNIAGVKYYRLSLDVVEGDDSENNFRNANMKITEQNIKLLNNIINKY